MNFMEEVHQDTQAWLYKLTTRKIMSETTSQSVAILNYLKTGNSLNPMEALNKFGCFRLAARIGDLRKEGHDIQTEMFSEENGKKYAVYSLPKIQKQGELF